MCITNYFISHITTSHIRNMSIRISRYIRTKLQNTPQVRIHVHSKC